MATLNKKFLASAMTVAVLVMALPIFTSANNINPDWSGDGLSKDTAYIITTAEQLAFLAERVNAGDADYNDKYYQLGDDIDLSDYGKDWNDGRGWIPIGNYGDGEPNNTFKGKFDGKNYVITNLYINYPTNPYYNPTGLFGRISSIDAWQNPGIVKNLAVEGANIKGNNRVGIIAGDVVDGSSIENCYVTGIVSGNEQVGGLVGIINGGNIVNCYTTCEADGNEAVGGLVGHSQGIVMNCYTT